MAYYHSKLISATPIDSFKEGDCLFSNDDHSIILLVLGNIS